MPEIWVTRSKPSLKPRVVLTISGVTNLAPNIIEDERANSRIIPRGCVKATEDLFQTPRVVNIPECAVFRTNRLSNILTEAVGDVFTCHFIDYKS
jgi:hypothetical protein